MVFRRGVRPLTTPVRFVDGLYAASRATRLRAHAELQAARLVDGVLARTGATKPAVFVSGFWRSGTTWLQECLAEALQAKTVFEPLSPLDPRRRAQLPARLQGDEDLAQAYIPDGTGGDDVFLCLDEAMTGCAHSPFTLSCRTDVRDSFRRSVVVKDVRAQCRLADIHARYGVSVVHLRRHPCAVVSSLVRANWHWSFRRVSLRQLFGEDSAVEFASTLPDTDTDEVSRIAFSWAWSERQAAAALAGREWARVVSYEDLTQAPDRTFSDLCTGLHLHQRRAVAFDIPSASINPSEFAGRGATVDRWRRDLAPDIVDRVERIATAVFPAWREPIGLPRGM